MKDPEAQLLDAVIRRDYPELNKPNITDWERVRILRRWVYSNVNWSDEELLLERDPTFHYYTRSAPELFAAFFKDQGGVYCGGAAYALMKVYEMYGYESYVLDMGKAGLITHVVTLAYINHDGKRVLSVHGPTYNYSLAHEDGTPYDYFDVIDSLKLKKAISVVGTEAEYPAYLTKHADCIKDDSCNIELIRQLPNGLIKFRSNNSKEALLVDSKNALEKLFKDGGYPLDFNYLFLYPLSIRDAAFRHTGLFERVSERIQAPIN